MQILTERNGKINVKQSRLENKEIKRKQGNYENDSICKMQKNQKEKNIPSAWGSQGRLNSI